MGAPQQTGEATERFRQRGYVHVPGFLVPQVQALAWDYVQLRIAGTADGQRVESRDQQVPGAPGIYGDSLMETLLLQAWPRIEAITGMRLWPSHSYWRMYRQGHALYAHSDDDHIEVNATVCLGHEGDAAWPLWVEDGVGYDGADRVARIAAPDLDRARALPCRPGDAIVYRGNRVKHWRQPNPNPMHAQLFLFFVDRNSEHAGRKFDGRPMLGWQDPLRWRTSDVGILLRAAREGARYQLERARRYLTRRGAGSG